MHWARTLSERLFRALFRFAFRYDIFISYARGDGAKYAIALKEQLTQLDFSCFLDVEELPPGNGLTRTLQRALKRSATLVAVVTERATGSPYCALEVEGFSANGRPIVPIDFGGTFAKAPWTSLKDRELVWIDETSDALARGVPSPIVADSIDRLFKYTRRNVRVRAQWIAVLVLFLLGTAVSAFTIQRQVNEARAASLEAERQKAEAVKQTAIATSEKSEAVRQTAIAGEATRTAKAAEDRASEAAAEAKQQQAIAMRSAAQALDEQRKAQAQTRLARSSSMAIDAKAQAGQRPLGAMLLAAEATQIVLRGGGARAPAAEDALRQALARTGGIPLTGHDDFVFTAALSADSRWLFTSTLNGVGRLWSMREPQLEAPAHELSAHKGPITLASFSPDGRRLATGGQDNVLRIWDLAAKPVVATHDLPLEGKNLGTRDREVRVVAWSPNGHLMAAAGAIPRLWDLSGSNPAATSVALEGHTYPVEKIGFSEDGRWLVTATRDPYVLLRPLASGAFGGNLIKLPTRSSVTFAVFSRDSRWLVVGDIKGSVRRFDLTAPVIVASMREIKSSSEAVYRGAISSDSRWLVVSGAGRNALLWDLLQSNEDGSPIALEHDSDDSSDSSIVHLRFSPDSRLLVTAGRLNSGAGAHVWRLGAPEGPAKRLALPGVGTSATAAAFIDNDRVAVGTSSGVMVWALTLFPSAATPVATLVGHDFGIEEVLVDGSGQWLVTVARDSTPRFWNLKRGEPEGAANDTMPRRLSRVARHRGAVVLNADGRWMISEPQDRLNVFVHAATGRDASFEPKASLEGAYLALSPDGRWLATSEATEVSSDVWRTGLALRELPLAGNRLGDRRLVGVTERKVDVPQRHLPPAHRMTAAAFSPDGKRVAAGRADGLVTLWSAPVTASDHGRPLPTHTASIRSVSFSRDGRWLATAGADARLVLWDLTASDPAGNPSVLSGHVDPVDVLVFSADGRWLFTAANTHDKPGAKPSSFVWDLRQPTTRGISLSALDSPVTAAAIGPDGRSLVTGSGGALALWDLSQRAFATHPLRLNGGNRGRVVSIVFSPDGRWLLTRFESSALLWDLKRAGPERRPFVMGLGMGEIRWASFTPDGRQLITGGYRERSLYAWDITTDDPTVDPVALQGDAGGVFAGDISADSRILVGAGNEGLKAWLLQPADLVARACRVAGRNLSVAEWEVLVPGQAYRKTCPQFGVSER